MRNDDPRAPRPERVAAFRVGLSAESRAAVYLIAKGFRIVARRFRSPVGEVDIVARRGRLLIFVEVKARSRLDDAAESLCRGSSGGSRRRQRPGSPSIRTTPKATSGSMPFWSRRDASRATSRRRSRPSSGGQESGVRGQGSGNGRFLTPGS
jgi:hypothetical protein